MKTGENRERKKEVERKEEGQERERKEEVERKEKGEEKIGRSKERVKPK